MLMSAVAKPSPWLEGRPSKAIFTVGAVGCIVNTIAAIWFLLATYVPARFWIIGYVLLMIDLSFTSGIYLDTHRNYGSSENV